MSPNQGNNLQVIPQVNQSKVDQSKVDQSKVDQSKVDQSKVDQSKVNQSKVDQLRSGYEKPLSINNFLRQASVVPDSSSTKKPIIFQKSIVIFFGSFAAFIMFLLRLNLSVSIIGMTEEKITGSNSTTDEYRFSWHNNENQQGLILGSYFWGYTACQVPAGRLAEKFGSKWVIGLGVFFSGILSLLTPLSADLGLVYFIVCRLLIGVCHASVLSTCYTLFSVWVPEKEKVRAVCWINIAFEIGGMSSLYLSGIISSNKALGWQYTFYLFSIVAFVWFIPYCFLVYSDPSQNPRLSNYEKKQLEQSRAIECSKNDFSKKYVKVLPKMSYKKIFTSGPVWASCIAKFTSNFGYYLLALKMASFLKEVFNVPLAQNGFLSASQYLGVLSSKLICLRLADYLQKKNLTSLTNLRKTFQFFSMIIPCICFALVPIIGTNQNIVTLLIFIGMFGHGLQCGGDAPIVSEFARDLSGSIFGLTNMFACLDGILAPIIVGIVVQNISGLRQAWNVIFYIAVVLYIIGIVVFLLFASAEPQEWGLSKFVEVDLNEIKKEKKKKQQVDCEK